MFTRGSRIFLALVPLVLLGVVRSHGATDLKMSKAEQEVRALERAWLDAYEQVDTVAMARIVADDFQITFPDGAMQTKQRILASLRRQLGRPGPYTTRFRTEEVSSRAYAGTTVILSGIVITMFQKDGTPAEDRSRYTDTYVKRGGKWQVVASHLSNVKAPAPAPGSSGGE